MMQPLKNEICTSVLAIDGGAPVNRQPFKPWPYYEEDEMAAVRSCMLSGKVNYWTGDECRNFETEYAEYVGVKHAIALTNGTVALELALYALGIGEGDEVITTCRTFIASASCAVMRGAKPVVVDVDRVNQNITLDTIKKAVTPKTKAIIAVHLAGWPCDMDPILEFANGIGIKVIEDCAQAHGATYKGRPVGSFGHVAAFSFCQDKIISTGGEGGVMLTNDTKLWKKAWAFKDHGKSYDAVHNHEHPVGFRWLHESFGTNWRMTELQGAIGRLQLEKLPAWFKKRNENAAILSSGFLDIPGLRVTLPSADIGHAYYKYYVFAEQGQLKDGWSRDKILNAINAEGIPCFTGSCGEIYLEKSFQDAKYAPVSPLPVARELGETSLCFLVHPTLDASDMEKTVLAVRKVMAESVLT
ncbi:MAG: DegT/DnrJ/EryC1/StrS aminotransferase family protein [Nitrosomonadales bacterium]|nr:DegT/DnrJ/EryC1/StrS aminotransferase family protein [Nitrosomonadales bacterium]